jgi:hypothetical protein
MVRRTGRTLGSFAAVLVLGSCAVQGPQTPPRLCPRPWRRPRPRPHHLRLRRQQRTCWSREPALLRAPRFLRPGTVTRSTGRSPSSSTRPPSRAAPTPSRVPSAGPCRAIAWGKGFSSRWLRATRRPCKKTRRASARTAPAIRSVRPSRRSTTAATSTCSGTTSSTTTPQSRPATGRRVVPPRGATRRAWSRGTTTATAS